MSARRIMLRAQWRDECPRPKNEGAIVHTPEGKVLSQRTSFNIWMIAKGLRHKTFQLRMRGYL